MKRSHSLWKKDRSCPAWRLSRHCNKSNILDDVNQAARARLGYACLIYVFTYFIAFFGAGLYQYFTTGVMPEYLTGYMAIIAAGSIVIAVGVFVMVHLRSCSTTQINNLGLVFEVVGALGISMPAFWGAFPPEIIPDAAAATRFMEIDLLDRCHIIGIPWTCVWIVTFPFLTPNSIKKAFIPTFLAASMGLIVVLVSRQAGATTSFLPISFYINYFLFSTYLCAIIACVSGHSVHKLNNSLRRAREYGSYNLLSLLGKGGMGEVWLAEHSMLARPAAVKLIHQEILGTDTETRESALRRFKREAQATSALRSTHTIDIYDFGTSKDGSFYYVMELLDGLNLDQFIKRFGPISAERTIHILRQACHSLLDAHESDMIHRDIKPANIYLCRLGPDYDFVKILDFGLVKTSRLANNNETQVTLHGSTLGSPNFMAPEMALGKKDIDARLDLYALGCVGYWLLTGQVVFSGENSVATLVQHIQTVPEVPSQRTEIEIPQALEEIILACLAKEPEDRPQSARDLDRLLAACQTTESWTSDKAREWWDLHIPEFEALAQQQLPDPIALSPEISEEQTGGNQ